MKEYEPHIQSYSALWVPTSGIIEPTSVVRQLKFLANCQDFVIENDSRYPNMIHIAGICSLELTSALAVAEYVKDMLTELLTGRSGK